MVRNSEWTNKYFILLLILLIPITLTSCITWVNPISPIDESQIDKRLSGAWMSEDSKVKIYIGKPLNGWMNFVYYEDEEDDRIFGKMYVSNIDERNFLNVTCLIDEGGTVIKEYIIFEYKINGKKGKLFSSSHDFLNKAIADKQLSVEPKAVEDYTINSKSEDIREFIKKSPKENLFPADDALILIKIR